VYRALYGTTMNAHGKVRIGHKAPHFQCEAITKGVIGSKSSLHCKLHATHTDFIATGVSLDTYINPAAETPNWLILLFIPAAFSFVCPTEVLGFQNCLDAFKERNCNVVFVSVDTKHSLWHWQNVPRQYGGIGQIDVSLLSDATHRMSRDYGVLIEEEGVCLRAMFIVDGEGIVQQVSFPLHQRSVNVLTRSRSHSTT
jgi:alkyl hydroperoxide reductase subunit AhpC